MWKDWRKLSVQGIYEMKSDPEQLTLNKKTKLL